MNTTSKFLADTAGNRPTASAQSLPPIRRRTVDAPTRTLHWLLALSFAGAYATAESESLRLLHTTLGYTMAGLIVARVVWGLIGPRPARLSSWGARLRPLWTLRPSNLLSRITSLRPSLNMLAVVGILLMATGGVLSGISLDQEWFNAAFMEDALEEFHEFAGNGTLMLVIAHLGLLVMGFKRQGTTQVMSMVTGRIPGKGPDLVHHNRVWLGALIWMCVLVFWAWQWQTRPAPTDHHTTHAQHGHHTDDDD
ncbi:MAG: cytochrome b/b6 domain-containing protein [Aquabacterium sp.]|uniref:cytochrome b/b6 domain-containing protein n=1 Tax=Aquabacterium sp. TaxID=1872578 RepID=UPI003BE20EBC